MSLSHASIHSASSWVEPRLEAHPIYICPDCHGPLEIAESALECRECRHAYPLVNGIPDFVRDDSAGRRRLSTRLIMPLIGLVAGIYETRLWYAPFLRVFGGPGAPSFRGLTEIMLEKMDFPAQGVILDAACGPATWGRRIAAPERHIHGIDLTWPMLRRGAAYVAGGRIPNVQLAHARVEMLPFQDATFDGAVCGGALHLFPDVVRSLKEIGRTMKPGARFVGMTFTHGDRGLLSLGWLRQRTSRDAGLHIFDLGELAEDLARAGFKHFDPVIHGSVLVFTAERVGYQK